MTTSDRFDRSVAAWLHEEASVRLPDHLGEVLTRTATTRQRPAWSSPGRWIPISVPMIRPPKAIGTSARLAFAGVLVVALLGLAAFVVASRQHRLPEPFGVARPGLIASWNKGDIFFADADGSNVRAVISGPTDDFGPTFSHDGTRFLFWRRASASAAHMMVADVDGRNVRTLTESLVEADWYEWAPRDDHVAVVHTVGGKRVLTIVDAIGDAPPRTLPLGELSVDNDVYWLPKDGTRLVFTARVDRSDSQNGLYTINADGTNLRLLRPEGADLYQDLAVSPEGTMLAYTNGERKPVLDDPTGPFTRWNPSPNSAYQPTSWRIHVLDLETGVEGPATNDASWYFERQPSFSPEGSGIVLLRYSPALTGARLFVVDLRSGSETPVGKEFTVGTVSALGYAPDGKSVYMEFLNGQTRVISLETGEVKLLDYSIHNFSSWQRLPLP